MADERRYWAFLVRLWSVQHNGELVWRASAENAHTGDRHAFADMESLFDFLRTMVENEPAVSGQKAGGCEENREMVLKKQKVKRTKSPERRFRYWHIGN